MGDLMPFTDAQAVGIARREFQVAADTVLPPLAEVAELIKWHAWAAMETEDPPDALVALEAWRGVCAAVAALETLRGMAQEWYGWASNAVPDGPLHQAMLDAAVETFAPQFVKAMAGRTE